LLLEGWQDLLEFLGLGEFLGELEDWGVVSEDFAVCCVLLSFLSVHVTERQDGAR